MSEQALDCAACGGPCGCDDGLIIKVPRPDAPCRYCGVDLRWDYTQEHHVDDGGDVWCPVRDNMWHHW